MPTTDSQANSPVMEFARTITHWCDAKLGFREWIASQGAEQCRYVASRLESEKKAYQEGNSDSCTPYERPHPPFEGETLSVGEIAIFAVDRFNRLNPKNKIAPNGLSGTANHLWHLSQIHESDLPTFGHNLSDSADEIPDVTIQTFLNTLEEQFTREALPDIFAAPRSTVDEVCAVAKEMRVRASGESSGVVAGALGDLRFWFYKAGGDAEVPHPPDSGTVYQDGVLDWLNDLIVACKSHDGEDKPRKPRKRKPNDVIPEEDRGPVLSMTAYARTVGQTFGVLSRVIDDGNVIRAVTVSARKYQLSISDLATWSGLRIPDLNAKLTDELAKPSAAKKAKPSAAKKAKPSAAKKAKLSAAKKAKLSAAGKSKRR